MLKRNKRKGFSLIEAVAAVVILAGLAATTVISFVVIRGNSTDKIDRQNIADLQDKVTAYYVEYGKWPDRYMMQLNRYGYTDTKYHETPYGGYYSFDKRTKKVVNRNRK